MAVQKTGRMSGGMTEEAVADRLEQHGEAFAAFLGDVQTNVLNSISAQSVGPEGFVENFQGMTISQVTSLREPVVSPCDTLSLCKPCPVMMNGDTRPGHISHPLPLQQLLQSILAVLVL